MFEHVQKILGTPSILTCCLFIYVAYLFALAFYRLYLSPIAHFPGSKITAISGWYETYWDVVKGGQFTFQIRRWHEKYGPIIRINPTEIHISDPNFYDTAYSPSLLANKLEALRDRFGQPTGLQATVEHAVHHRRRMPLNPYFSKKQINMFCPHIQQCAERLCSRLLREYKGTNKVVTLNDAWAAYAADIVFFYCFAWSYEFLDYPDFVAPFTNSIKELTNSLHVARHFPWFLKLLQSLPGYAVGIINPAMIPVFEFKSEIESQIIKIINGENEAHKIVAHKTVLSSLLTSDLPPEELSVTRLRHEAEAFIGAGIETTKSALSLASFHILDNPDILRRLREELINAIPDPGNPPPLSELERLPYLTAVIQEALRLSYGVAARLPRTLPNSSLIYNETYTIPPNTPFSMSSYQMHHSSVFPDSHAFDPDRWLNKPVAGSDRQKPLSRYLVSFSRGTRACIGVNLAWAELYIALATVFRRVDFELFETGKEAVEMAREFFVPQPRLDTKGVRVIVQ